MREPYLPPKAYSLVHNWWMRLLIWREKHMKERTFVIILALVVGLAAGLASMTLKWLIHIISGSLTSDMHVNEGNWTYIIYPVVGVMLATWYVRYVVRDDISHGVTRVLYSISQNKSRLKPHNMYTSIVASSITIGFGGSVGAEGPIVYTGAAIGSNLGQAFRLSPRVLMILVGCGAAAGIAGIFKAPIAGMLFTLEVLMLDLTTVTVMPLLMASITAASVAYIFTGYDLEFFFVQSEPFVMERLPYFIGLGVMCGMVSLYFTKVMFAMETFFRKAPRAPLAKDIGGLCDTRLARIPFSSALRRRLRLHQLSAQRRPGVDSRRFNILRRPCERHVHSAIHRHDYLPEAFRHLGHQWCRRCGRHIRPFALRRMHDRIFLRLSPQQPRFRA